MASTSNNHWTSEHLKNRWVKLPIIILLYSVVLFILFLIGKSIVGYNVIFFGIETNPKKPDTIRISTIKYDTVGYQKSKEDAIRVNPQNKIPILKQIPQKGNDKGHSEVNTVNGANYGIVGGSGNSVTNFFAPKARTISIEVLGNILSKIPDKNTLILICNTSSDGESIVFRNDIVTKLKSRGYDNLIIPKSCLPDSRYYMEEAITYGIDEQHQFFIYIPPILPK